ncbi:relaxase/mobilization nuclease domain-containing protein [Enterococcus hirae]|uniref:relaxase/mobilization nuclease domain-containing protein n=2 Tax=Enterococcus TaxID=1350 RepID=UPI002DB6194E|nr:relaxase/mobilization nuclease domain-containing protein [Enterococcus hirae]MEB7441136.1 relaxase/mobilization nuclease domain-containing protein [Enterococcus hirae]
MATVKVSRTASCSRAINYAEPRATIKQGINCDIDYAKSEMKQIRMLYGKDDRVQAHLLIQSFRPGEITAEKANQLGAEYAKKIAPDHQIAIYTHTDKDHIHNHIVINSVNLETGKKFQAHGQAFLNKCYDLNDEICLEHDLTITERGKKPEKRTLAEIKLNEKNKSVWKDTIRLAIDQTMKNQKIRTYEQFCASLKTFGIQCINRGKTFTYELIDQKKKVRSNKLGTDYEKETIINELDKRERTHQKRRNRRTDELRRSRAIIRGTAEEIRREQRTFTPEQSEIRPTRRNHEQYVERGKTYEPKLSL